MFEYRQSGSHLSVLFAIAACGPVPAPSLGSGEPVSATDTTAAEVTSAPVEEPPIPIPDMGLDEPPSSFITQPDGGGGVSFECDIFTQDCDEGFKCNPWANDGGAAWNATKCFPVVPDPDQPGEPCTVEGSGVGGMDTCDVGAMCWNVDEDGAGVCQEFCQGSAEAPVCDNPDLRCNGSRNIPLCVASCCPVEQDCVETEGCYPGNDDFHCAPDASGEDNGTFGDACEFINACAPGHACVGADAMPECSGSVGCCTPYCTVGESMCSDLDPALGCEAWFVEGQAPPGLEHVGVCVLAV